MRWESYPRDLGPGEEQLLDAFGKRRVGRLALGSIGVLNAIQLETNDGGSKVRIGWVGEFMWRTVLYIVQVDERRCARHVRRWQRCAARR